MTSKDQPPTSDRLRIDIDHGLAADKVAWPDPAAAPLGTDDEAAGAPPTAEERALAAAHENRAGEHRARAGGKDPRLIVGWAAVVVLFCLAAFAAVLALGAR